MRNIEYKSYVKNLTLVEVSTQKRSVCVREWVYSREGIRENN